MCERHVGCEQMPGIANRQWYSVERYTSQARPSAAKRATGLLSTRCDGYDAAFAGLAAAVVAHARGGRNVRASHIGCVCACGALLTASGIRWKCVCVTSVAKRGRTSYRAAQHTVWCMWGGCSRPDSSCSAHARAGCAVRASCCMHACIVRYI